MALVGIGENVVRFPVLFKVLICLHNLFVQSVKLRESLK